MAPIAAFVPVQVQMAVWRIALGDTRRKPTSGGPRDRAAHLAYQREYQRTRRTFGVRVGGTVAHYLDRAAYAAGRHLNDGVTSMTYHAAGKLCRCELCLMVKLPQAVADRWSAHVDQGGSLKALCYTQDEWLAKRRQREAERTPESRKAILASRREDYARRKAQCKFQEER